jgi:hypothetical protein
MASSLHECEGISRCSIRVYDDASPFWDEAYLRRVFPSAKEIVRRKKNLGADGNMRQMFVDFLETGDDALLVADSDLIFRPDMIACVESVLEAAGGIMSLYNSAIHSPHESCAVCGVPFAVKKTIGAAGTVMTRRVVEMIVANVPASSSYDWDWSRYLALRNVPLLVTEESFVQHIGVHGQNSSSFATEYGLNFYPGSRRNEIAAAEFFDHVIRQKDELIRSYRVFKPLRYPGRSAKVLLGRFVMMMRKLAGR